jgi:hypothetical protein
VDPNANFLEKGLAAVAGYEGVKVVKEHFDGEQAGEQQASADPPGFLEATPSLRMMRRTIDRDGWPVLRGPVSPGDGRSG